jgi:hypothetical protein
MSILSGGSFEPERFQLVGHQDFGDDVEFHILGAGFKLVQGDCEHDFVIPYQLDLYGGGLDVVSGNPHDEDTFSFRIVVPGNPEVVAAELITDKGINGGEFRIDEPDCSTLPKGLKLRISFKRGQGFVSPANDYKAHAWFKVRKWR